jgi:hypothetical protein
MFPAQNRIQFFNKTVTAASTHFVQISYWTSQCNNLVTVISKGQPNQLQNGLTVEVLHGTAQPLDYKETTEKAEWMEQRRTMHNANWYSTGSKLVRKTNELVLRIIQAQLSHSIYVLTTLASKAGFQPTY